MNIWRLLTAAGALGAVLWMAPSADAAYLYNSLIAGFLGANCAFSTTCAADIGVGDDFAAQLFTLSSAAVVTGGQWTEVDDIGGGTTKEVNYAFYTDDGGLPGTLLYSGSSPDTATVLATSPTLPYEQVLISFGIPSVSLTAGSYFLAIQSVSSVHDIP